MQFEKSQFVMKRINFLPNCEKDCQKYMDFIFENYLKRNSKILISALIGFIDWPKLWDPNALELFSK